MRLLDDIRKFVELKIEAARIEVAWSASEIFSAVMATVIAVALAIVAATLAAFRLSAYLDTVMGCCWGTVTVCGALLLLSAILFASRRSIFHWMFFRKIIASLRKKGLKATPQEPTRR